MIEKIILWLVMFVLFFVMYGLFSTANPAYSARFRNMALFKIKKPNGKYKYKLVSSKKAVLKEFIYTKNFLHLPLNGIRGVESVYFFDIEGYLYEFNKNVARKQTIEQIKSFADATRPSFFDIYNFMSINKFVGISLNKVDEDERSRRSKTPTANG